MKKVVTIVILVSLMASYYGCKKDISKTTEPKSDDPVMLSEESLSSSLESITTKPYADNQVIVKFRLGKPDEAFLKSQNAKIKESILTAAMKTAGYTGLHVLLVPNVSKAVIALRNNPNVEWAEPNYIVSHEAYTPNDPYYPNSLWGMDNIKASTAWNTNTGDQQVFIGVIDEGIMYWHEDLCGQIWTNPYETENGKDDDGNGYIDDVHGWDFMHNDKTIFDNADNHGTHVSGTIGGIGNNGKGVIGVSPNVTIISGKFLEGSGYISNAIKAVDYMTDLKTRHNMNIAATSNSWGGPDYIQGMYDAINRARAADILFVAAAGNAGSNNDIKPFYPSGYTLDNVISVAAYNSLETLPTWTNYGATSVDIGAPGVNIVSTVPGSTGTSAYSAYNGTSMATPHVSGAVALYKAGNPTATYTQVRNAILNNARPIAALSGKCVTGGVLNIESFTKPTTNAQVSRGCVVPDIDFIPPTKPVNFRLVSKDSAAGTALVAWDAATDNVAVTRYDVSIRYPWYILTAGQFSTTFSYQITGLSGGVVYDVSILAADAWNNKSETATLKFDFGNDTTPPPAPKNLRTIGITPTTLTMAYDPSIDNWSGTTMYRISIWPINCGTCTTQRYWWSYNSDPIKITGLATGIPYTITIAAMDMNRNFSAESDVVYETPRDVSDATPPSAPTLSSTASTTSSVSLAWSGATDNIGVSGYNVFYKTAGSSSWIKFSSTSATSVTVTGLQSGTIYDFYVNAYDASANTSVASNVVTRSTASTVSIYTKLSGSIVKKTTQKLSWTTTISPSNLVIAKTELQMFANNMWTTLYTQTGSSLSGTYSNLVNDKTTRTYRVLTTLTTGQVGYSNTMSLTSR